MSGEFHGIITMSDLSLLTCIERPALVYLIEAAVDWCTPEDHRAMFRAVDTDTEPQEYALSLEGVRWIAPFCPNRPCLDILLRTIEQVVKDHLPVP